MSEELRQQMVEELTGQHVRPDFAGLLTRRGAEWLADTLLSGPLAPLLASMERVETLAEVWECDAAVYSKLDYRDKAISASNRAALLRHALDGTNP